jgi:hypothetical protein
MRLSQASQTRQFYFRVVKSVSFADGSNLPSAAFSQVHESSQTFSSQIPVASEGSWQWEPLTSRTSTAGTCGPSKLLVLGGSPVAGALSRGTGPARAARPTEFVLGRRLLAGAVESVLFAAGTSGPLGCI